MATKCVFEEKASLLIFHEKLFNHPPFGMTSRCRISVTECQYIVHIMMKEVERRLRAVELYSQSTTSL